MPPSHYAQEREMNRHQRGLVDTCFEEGHYESGISILDKLRSPMIRPSPAHIRQLIYIALFPPAISAFGKEKGKDKERDIFGTPSKVPNATKHTKASLLPTAEATEAALTLLTAFAITNSPGSLLRAIPCYPLTDAERATTPGADSGSGLMSMESDENEDSLLARDAAALKDCSDCWSLLKDGVVKRKDDANGTSHERRTARQQRSRSFLEDEEESDADESFCPVGKHSWPILEWVVSLFEKEESIANSNGSDAYSLSLLSQIKPLRTGTGARRDADSPLNIVFACYKQTEPRRVRVGASLMASLISLTYTPHFSASHLITATSSRLRSFDMDILSTFLSDLPTHGRGLAFKLAICDRYLTDSPKGGTGMNTGSGSAAKPQARRARPLHAPLQKDSAPGAPQNLSKSQSNPRPSLYPWVLPTPSRILQILQPKPQFADVSVSHYLVKFHILMAFGALKARESSADNVLDIEWAKVLKDNQLERKISDCFSWDSSELDKMKTAGMRGVLLAMVENWRESLCC